MLHTDFMNPIPLTACTSNRVCFKGRTAIHSNRGQMEGSRNREKSASYYVGKSEITNVFCWNI